jgi:HSP20 family protein
MKIVPWRASESRLPSAFDIDGLWKSLWEEGNGEIASRLPELFRTRPFPAINVAETEDSFCITMDCPGMEEKDFRVERMGSQLLISGERKWEQEKKDKEFRRVESQYGSFRRAIDLPTGLVRDADAIQATFQKGVLEVRIPKVEPKPVTKVKVKAK